LRTSQPQLVASLAAQKLRGQAVRVMTGKELLGDDMGPQRLGAWVFSGFGFAALLLVVGGTFGLVAYLAESQRREFAVRMALGADWSNLVHHAVSVAVAPVGLGVFAGLCVGALTAHIFEALLVGIGAFDVATYFTVAVGTLLSAAAAAVMAAWRVRRTNPSDALRAI
jgi:ABC-type antimicrobial peptide transport system permease subunit